MTRGTPAPGTPRSTATIKRAIKHVVVFALLGLILSAAVAVACVFFAPQFPRSGAYVTADRHKVAGRIHTFGRDEYTLENRFDIPRGSAGAELARSTVLRLPYDEQARFVMGSPAEGTPMNSWLIVEAGWPLSAAWSWRHFVWYPSDEDAVDARRGLVLLGESADFYRIVPYLVLWPGLILNTAFYGSILWLLWLTVSRGPGMIRRGRRRRRGLCVRCGYDLRGSRGLETGAKCTECGG